MAEVGINVVDLKCHQRPGNNSDSRPGPIRTTTPRSWNKKLSGTFERRVRLAHRYLAEMILFRRQHELISSKAPSALPHSRRAKDADEHGPEARTRRLGRAVTKGATRRASLRAHSQTWPRSGSSTSEPSNKERNSPIKFRPRSTRRLLSSRRRESSRNRPSLRWTTHFGFVRTLPKRRPSSKQSGSRARRRHAFRQRSDSGRVSTPSM